VRIGEASAAAGLTPRALRYYEQRGLLASRRTPSGHRDYDEADVHRLRIIRELLGAGLTIGDLQAFTHVLNGDFAQKAEAAARLTDDQIGHCPVVEVTNRRLAELDQRIERLTELRARLANALTYRFDKLFGGAERPVTPQAVPHR
jgi:DNA-binding transcriptional MerR regulator